MASKKTIDNSNNNKTTWNNAHPGPNQQELPQDSRNHISSSYSDNSNQNAYSNQPLQSDPNSMGQRTDARRPFSSSLPSAGGGQISKAFQQEYQQQQQYPQAQQLQKNKPPIVPSLNRRHSRTSDTDSHQGVITGAAGYGDGVSRSGIPLSGEGDERNAQYMGEDINKFPEQLEQVSYSVPEHVSAPMYNYWSSGSSHVDAAGVAQQSNATAGVSGASPGSAVGGAGVGIFPGQSLPKASPPFTQASPTLISGSLHAHIRSSLPGAPFNLKNIDTSTGATQGVNITGNSTGVSAALLKLRDDILASTVRQGDQNQTEMIVEGEREREVGECITRKKRNTERKLLNKLEFSLTLSLSLPFSLSVSLSLSLSLSLTHSHSDSNSGSMDPL